MDDISCFGIVQCITKLVMTLNNVISNVETNIVTFMV